MDWWIASIIIGCSLLLWLAVAFAPDRAYLYRETLIGANSPSCPPVSAVIPARNEEEILPLTLPSVLNQDYPELKVILVDDHSLDRTREVAERLSVQGQSALVIVAGRPLPDGWAGKMWAISQGISAAKGEWLLLTDADIYYPPDMVSTLVGTALEGRKDMVSLMARLSTDFFWEKLLIPAFLYFFKLLYPFRAVSDPRRRTAAAAGGCILVRRETLDTIGGIAAIQDELIDDIALAKALKAKGFSIMLLTAPRLLSKRSYRKLAEIWRMVTRSAFTELKYSYLRLLFCALAMSLAFIVPVCAVLSPLFCSPSALSILIFAGGVITWAIMSYTYHFSTRYFELPTVFALTLPIAGILYFAMTIDSAVRYSLGLRASWKGRTYRSP